MLVLPALLGGPWAFANASDFVVSLTEPDQYVLRAVSGKHADGTPLKGVLEITAYEAATKTFVFDTSAQGTSRVSADTIDELVFKQSLRQSSPQAQTCPFAVTATRGATVTLEVPANDLRLDQSKLKINVADATLRLGSGAIIEAQRIVYNRKKNLFSISLQEVKYDIQMQDCGSTSPGRSKALQ